MHTCIGQSSESIRQWLRERGLLEELQLQVTRPLLPLPDNFTAPTRTPWGGTKILGKYKRNVTIRPEKQFPIVGESWEISADPAAPCQFTFNVGEETILIDFIQLVDLFPIPILGEKVAHKFEHQNPLLVKLLDAADHLSVQVHPSDEYAGLQADESGKPESWYILEAEEGCGLYFGLKEGVSEHQLRLAIEQEGDVAQYLNFVEVRPEDFFVIDAGTIHAVGAGVTLIEPQKIAPKKSGKTYRLWDWNRKYDDEGKPDSNGKPRQLHIKESLEIIDFDDLRGDAFIEHIQPERRIIQQQGNSVETLLVDTENFGVRQVILHADYPIADACSSSFHALLPYTGHLELYQQDRKCADIPQGQSVIIPACFGAYELRGNETGLIKVYYPAQHV
jgi:mannose-6-phosphate isomerase